MKHALLPLLVLVAAGSLAKADTLNYKYTWHIDGVVLPGDGLKLPSIELAFLAADDLAYGPPAIYDFNETTTNVEPLYLRESVSPSSPFYLSPFESFSGFSVGFHEIGLTDEFYMGNIAGYDNNLFGQPSLAVDLPGPGLVGIATGEIYGYSDTFTEPNGEGESALTNYTLRLDVVPEPSAGSLLAVGVMGILGLAMFRKKAHFSGNGDIAEKGV